MPKKPIDYSKTIFYKLVCSDLSVKDCYIGHTTSFRKRKTVHKNTCKNPNVADHNMPVYKFIRENGGWENWRMIEIDTLYCRDKIDAEKKEREFIEQMTATLNRNKPYTTIEEKKAYKKEWTNNNWDRVKEQKQIWWEEHKHISNEKKKEKMQCNCGSCIRIADFNRHEKTKKHQAYLNSLQDW